MTATLDPREGLLDQLASLTHTDRADWFLTFKARHAMQVALGAAARAMGRDTVVTQLFTCVTAVDPILAAGLTPAYADISSDTLALDPALVRADERTCAVVAQHTFGIIDERSTRQLRDQAHAAGALLLEDCAHCVGRMARDEDGRPLADLSVHSFGVEKMIPGVYFGGAVWVSPAMDPDVGAAVRAALGALPQLPKSLDRATRRYRNQMRVFTRLPHAVSVAMRSAEAKRGTFEPAVSEAEQRGEVNHEAYAPSEWVAQQALGGLSGLGANEDSRRACVAAYLQAFADSGIDGSRLLVPAAVRDAAADQPLLRFPVFFPQTAQAERAIAAVASQGHYAQSWPRPLLLPGVLDPAAYGLEGGTAAWPVCERLSAGVVGLPTDIDPAAVPAVAEAMLQLARG